MDHNIIEMDDLNQHSKIRIVRQGYLESENFDLLNDENEMMDYDIDNNIDIGVEVEEVMTRSKGQRFNF